MKRKVAIIGAGGFTGLELIRLLSDRSDVEISRITSNEYKGKKLVEVFPALQKDSVGQTLFTAHPESVDELDSIDFVFLATPDNVSMQWSPLLVEKGIRVIDISGAFRLQDRKIWEQFYKLDHTAFELVENKTAVYGLVEKNREAIKSAKLIANPGCYPSSVLVPFIYLKEFLQLFESSIIIDSKSGTSGAGGRKEKDSLGYSTVYENFRAYRIEAHQHQPEIEQEINNLTDYKFKVRFTPHLLPLFRGIYSIAYLKPKSGAAIDVEKIMSEIKNKIENEAFVRFYDNPNDLELKNVQNTNFVDFALHYDHHADVFMMMSVIDNLRKGAAGSGVQNMNLMMGADETSGLI